MLRCRTVYISLRHDTGWHSWTVSSATCTLECVFLSCSFHNTLPSLADCQRVLYPRPKFCRRWDLTRVWSFVVVAESDIFSPFIPNCLFLLTDAIGRRGKRSFACDDVRTSTRVKYKIPDVTFVKSLFCRCAMWDSRRLQCYQLHQTLY